MHRFAKLKIHIAICEYLGWKISVDILVGNEVERNFY